MEFVVSLSQQLSDLWMGAQFAKTPKPVTQLRDVSFPVLRSCNSSDIQSQIKECALECLVINLRGHQKQYAAVEEGTYVALDTAELDRYEESRLRRYSQLVLDRLFHGSVEGASKFRSTSNYSLRLT